MTATGMSCERVREELEALHYGDLPGDERAPVEAHLAGCGPCRAALEAVRETAAQLDSLTVPEPSEHDWARFESRLEARVAPLRARRFAWTSRRLGRALAVAAAFLIGGLAVTSVGLYVQTREQEHRIAQLTDLQARQAFRNGEFAQFRELTAQLATAEQSNEVREQLAAAPKLADEPDVAKMYLRAQDEADPEVVREKLIDLMAQYPKHAVADQAFLQLGQKGRITLRPLERAVNQPFPLLKREPDLTSEQILRRGIDRLREAAATGSPKLKGWALLRAGNFAEEVKDPGLALDLYLEAERAIPSGPLHEAAKERAGILRKP